MATKSLCKIDGCGKPAVGRGWCNAHWLRWKKYGDPTFLVRPVSCLDWIKAHADHQGDDCLIWPFGKSSNGRGAVKFRGRQTTAPHVMCTVAHGERPSPLHEAAHSCGKGHEGCVHPGHLRWATPLENAADMQVHGTAPKGARNPSVKLSKRQVVEIVALSGKKTQKELAAMYGVDQTHISRVLRGKSWGVRNPAHKKLVARGSAVPRAKLTEEDVRAIRQNVGNKTRQDLADEFGVTPWTIARIQSGDRWGWVT